jgi:HNH endonuclease
VSDTRTVPSGYAIARWWIANPDPLYASFVCDLGEPSCFACGWYDQRAPTYPAVTLAVAWQVAKLERAHLRPHALGGSDEPSNIVMLCDICHHAAPDWLDPDEMLAWVGRRESYYDRTARHLREAWQEIRPGQPMPTVTVEQVLAVLDSHGSNHAGIGIKASTVALAIARAGGLAA